MTLAASLTQLESSGLIRLAQMEPELEYLFRHALIQDAAYESILKADRRILHRVVAETVERVCAEHLEEVYGVLAHHYQRAEVSDKAIKYLIQAADQARQRYANEDAIYYYTQALALTADDTSQFFDLLLARVDVYNTIALRPAQARDLDALLVLAHQLDDDARRAAAHRRYADYTYVTADYSATITYAQQAIHFAQAAGDLECEARGHLVWGAAFWGQTDFARAQAQFEQVLAVAQRASLPALEAESLRSLGIVCETQSQYAQATAYFNRALEIYRQSGNRRGEDRCLNSLGVVAHHQLDFDRAHTYFEQSLAVKRALGDRNGESVTLQNLGEITRHNHDFVAAQNYFETGLSLCRDIQNRDGEIGMLTGLGEIHRYFGQHASAQSQIEEALRLARAIGDQQGESTVLLNLANLMLDLEQPVSAHEMGQQVLNLAEANNLLHEKGYALTLMGQALEALGNWSETSSYYQQSLELRRELGQAELCLEPLAGLARTALQLGDLPRASAYIDELLTSLEQQPTNTIEQPTLIHLTIYQVLHTTHDPRATRALETGYQHLLTEAAHIADSTARQVFLDGNPLRRALQKAWAVHQLQSHTT